MPDGISGGRFFTERPFLFASAACEARLLCSDATSRRTGNDRHNAGKDEDQEYGFEKKRPEHALELMLQNLHLNFTSHCSQLVIDRYGLMNALINPGSTTFSA